MTFQMVICSTHPLRWPDLKKHWLAWLKYDLAFGKDAAVTGTSDWSRMNLYLYNFHLHNPLSLTNWQFQPPPLYWSQLARTTVPASFFFFLSPGTMDSAVALLGKATTIMFAVHVMETTLGSAAHLSLPGMLTCQEYLSAQCRYVHFCSQDGHVGSDEALLPADEGSLMQF